MSSVPRQRRVRQPKPSEARRVLFTGFPSFTARRMLARLLEDPDVRVLALVQEQFVAELQNFAPDGRVEPLTGDVAAMDLGLSGAEVARLVAEVEEVYHFAAIYHLGVPRSQVVRVNVEGTRNVLDLAREMKRLRRFHHLSTAFVAGRREGLILESDLDGSFGFYNAYEQTRHQAEVLVRRAMRDLPVTVYRPSIIVGDSRTGEIDKFEGPYYFMVAIVGSPVELPLPLPGRGDAPLNLVPVDYVVEAAYRIGRDPRAVGRTFHLVDPNPLPARRVFELVAARAGKPPPRGVIPGGRLLWEVASRLLSRIPALERVLSMPRQAFEQFHHRAIYDASGTAELLEGTGIACPPLESYVDHLVAYIQRYYRDRRQRRSDERIYDPLA